MPDHQKVDFDELSIEERIRRVDETIRPFRRRSMLLTEAEVLARVRPQDWLVQGMIERGYVYALTGATSSGKTAVALAMAYRMGNPDMEACFARCEVERSRVLYLAGENPVDVYRRMLAMRLHHDLRRETNIRVVEGVLSLKDQRDAVAKAITEDGPVDLVVVDTAAAFFSVYGADENDNAAMGGFARLLRDWTRMPGNPAVLVLCHPAKFVTSNDGDAMVPRGGSAFLAEIDGNLTIVVKSDSTAELHHTSKLRGPGFEPIPVDLKRFTHDAFNDTKGRPSSTVIAVPLSTMEESERDARAGNRREKIVAAIRFAQANPLSAQAICEVTDIPKATVYRALDELKKAGVIRVDPITRGYVMAGKDKRKGD